MRQFFYSDHGYIEHDTWQPDCWVNVVEPSHDDIHYIVHTLGVPEEYLDDLEDVDERPRIEGEAPWMLTILRVPMQDSSGLMPYTTVPIGIITGEGIILTVCYHRTEMLPDFVEHTQRRNICINRPEDFILRIIFSSTYWYLRYLKNMSADVTLAERKLEKSVRNNDLLALMRLQKTLVYFNTSLHGNESLIDRLKRVFGDNCDADLLDDLEIEMRQANNTVSVYSEILAGTLDAFASVISNNVNQIMKRMTSISIILMVPTLIASFYGMNVGDIAFANVPGAFLLVVCGAFGLAAVTYLWLRHIKWF